MYITSIDQIKDSVDYYIAVYEKLPSGNNSSVANTYTMKGEEFKTEIKQNRDKFNGKIQIQSLDSFIQQMMGGNA